MIKIQHKLFHFFFLFLLIFTSCSVEKRKYLSGYNVQWNNASPDHSKGEEIVNKNEKQVSPVIPAKAGISSTTTDFRFHENDNDLELIASTSKISFKKNLQSSIFNLQSKDSCDIIILKNGEEIKAKVLEITSTEIKYKRFDFLDGPTITVNKSEVFLVKYLNGNKDLIVSNEKKSHKKEINNFALAGFTIGLFGLFFGIFAIIDILLLPYLLFLLLGWAFGLIAIVLCSIGLLQIFNNPDKYSGKSIAIIGLILGIIILPFWLWFINNLNIHF